MKVDELKVELARRETIFRAVSAKAKEKNTPTWDARAYDAVCRVWDVEHTIETLLGRERCPKCSEWTVKVTVTPTRQYGGGEDTFYQCENEACDYADVCV